jgi:hypothetical protein
MQTLALQGLVDSFASLLAKRPRGRGSGLVKCFFDLK